MIDLKQIITKYPECLDSAMKLKSFLADLYPEEKARCSILATIFDVGIAEQIKSGKVDNLSVDSYCNSLEDTYGYSPRLIRECIFAWGEAFDANEESKTTRQRKLSTPLSDFIIVGDLLRRYRGDDAEIVIPDFVVDIEGGAFNGCTSLKSIEIPNSVTLIRPLTFSGCTSLERIEIPNSVTAIGCQAFEDCESLESIVVPESVTMIDDCAFRYCKALKRIVIPNSITRIQHGTFSGCKLLKNFVIPNSVTSIHAHAFSLCTSLKSIVIPDSVIHIEDHAFFRCTSLESIIIPNSVTAIGIDAFRRCSSLTIKCYRGSYAEQYATENRIDIEYLD